MKIEKILSVVRLWSLACLLSCSGTLSACSGGDDGVIDEGDKGLPAGNVTVKVIGDKKTVLRNPLNGGLCIWDVVGMRTSGPLWDTIT